MTIARLDERVEAEHFGGKAAQLATLVRAGLPVPRGIALSVELVETAAAGDPASADQVERGCSVVRPPLAVRSSAVDEDSESASFAGQHLTVLNLGSTEEVLEAIREVWLSARSESALAYRERLGLAGTPRTAVVIQELVDADCAGVLFTRNPIDGADEIVIEAAWGLGEAVVAGLVTPDRVRVARDGTVLERVAGVKDLAVVRSPTGGTWQEAIEGARARMLCLTDRQLAELAQLGERCERVFGGGLDIEWAYVDGTLHLLQCRPITRAAPARC